MYDLNQRFGFEPDLSSEAVQERLKVFQERIRKEILTEMKIKEGAENIRKAAGDKKSVNVSAIVKQANSKLEVLNQELQELNTYLLLTSSNNSSVSKYCNYSGTP